MITITSYWVAVIMCVVTMICCGSWGNTQKLASKEWKFQFFYWDFNIGLLLFSLFMAFTMGSLGDGRVFVDDLLQANGKFIASALFGGLIFNISNILLVVAIDIAGLAVAFPIGIGLALVIGVIQNYQSGQCNPYLLGTGVGLIVLAILINALAYALRGGSSSKSSAKGIVISIVAGSLMGLFYSYVAEAMSSVEIKNGAVILQAGKMTAYTAMVIFALGIFLSSFVLNTLIMLFPLHGEKVAPLDYFRKGTPKLHLVGMLGGAIWSIGTCFNFAASTTAGVSISWGLGQGAALVSAFWGVFVWKEFKGSPKSINTLLALMFTLFILGLGILIASK